MSFGRFGIILSGILAIGALSLIELFPSIVGEAIYPIVRLKSLVRGAVRDPEVARLRREVDALSMLRGECARLEEENAALRNSLGFRNRSAGEWESAEVLSSGGGAASVRETIRVGKGSLSGIRKGAAVATSGGLVGRVRSVSPHTAEVLLLTDPSVRVSCRVETRSGGSVHGILTGGGAERMVLGHLGDAQALRPRSKVVTSGLGGVFPKGIEVGTLLLVTNGVRGVEGEVLPCVDFSTLEDVFIRRDR